MEHMEELYLELRDDQWPFTGIDHDRRPPRGNDRRITAATTGQYGQTYHLAWGTARAA